MLSHKGFPPEILPRQKGGEELLITHLRGIRIILVRSGLIHHEGIPSLIFLILLESNKKAQNLHPHLFR